LKQIFTFVVFLFALATATAQAQQTQAHTPQTPTVTTTQVVGCPNLISQQMPTPASGMLRDQVIHKTSDCGGVVTDVKDHQQTLLDAKHAEAMAKIQAKVDIAKAKDEAKIAKAKADANRPQGCSSWMGCQVGGPITTSCSEGGCNTISGGYGYNYGGVRYYGGRGGYNTVTATTSAPAPVVPPTINTGGVHFSQR
jgi:hypothetical protein